MGHDGGIGMGHADRGEAVPRRGERIDAGGAMVGRAADGDDRDAGLLRQAAALLDGEEAGAMAEAIIGIDMAGRRSCVVKVTLGVRLMRPPSTILMYQGTRRTPWVSTPREDASTTARATAAALGCIDAGRRQQPVDIAGQVFGARPLAADGFDRHERSSLPHPVPGRQAIMRSGTSSQPLKASRKSAAAASSSRAGS